VTDRWVPDPRPGDGPDGQGESGSAASLPTRRATEEAARSGRFDDGATVRDDSNPIEPEDAGEPGQGATVG
jgi:hypothetical protein